MNLDQVTLIGDAFDHSEGVAYFDGCWYAGGEAGQIWQIDAKANIAQVAAVPGMVLGLALDGDGKIYACDAGSRTVWQIDGPNVRAFCRGTPERPMVNPNWGVFGPTGEYWVSDSGHWQGNDGVIYRIDAKGTVTVWFSDACHFPNGMALHPDGVHLYVVESTLPGISRVRIGSDGAPLDYQVVLRLERTVPDGIAFDQQGGLYIGYYRPDRIDYWAGAGRPEIFLDDWQGTVVAAPTNVAFGGHDYRDLLLASLGRWSLGKVLVDIPGAPLNYPRSR